MELLEEKADRTEHRQPAPRKSQSGPHERSKRAGPGGAGRSGAGNISGQADGLISSCASPLPATADPP